MSREPVNDYGGRARAGSWVRKWRASWVFAPVAVLVFTIVTVAVAVLLPSLT